MRIKSEEVLKTRIKDWSWSILLLLTTVGSGFAQSFVTLEQAVEEGLSRNPELLAVRFERGIAKATSVESWLSPVPKRKIMNYRCRRTIMTRIAARVYIVATIA